MTPEPGRDKEEMTAEHERWALAAKLLDVHGTAIGDFIKHRVDDLTDMGNLKGLRFWHDIAAKLVQLIEPAEGSRHQ
ncbi:MAG: DUF6961 family protein [Sphingobium sp.]